MPKRAKKILTQRRVNELQPPRRGSYEVPDGIVPGQRLRVKSSCTKSYYLYFRNVNKVPTSRKIGDHPGLSLADARAIGIAARESGDPKTYLSGAAPEDTRIRFAELAEEFIARGLVQRRGGVRRDDANDEMGSRPGRHRAQPLRWNALPNG